MALREDFRKSGEWLFRRRSYLPLLLSGLFLLAFLDFRYPYGNHLLDRLWELFCLSVSFAGLGVRILTIGYAPWGTSGRNTKGQVAEVMNTTGVYSIVRHPLYLGNFLIWVGISLYARVWWFSLIIVLIWWIYYERIMFAEEEFLQEKFGEAFTEWADKTPAFFPRFRNWTTSDLSFSLKTVIRKEYGTFFAVIAVFTVMEIIGEIVVHGSLGIDPMWGIIFSIGLVIYLSIRIIQKRTTWLQVAGR